MTFLVSWILTDILILLSWFSKNFLGDGPVLMVVSYTQRIFESKSQLCHIFLCRSPGTQIPKGIGMFPVWNNPQETLDEEMILVKC